MRALLVLPFAIAAFGAEDFAEIQAKITSFTLDNGLTVILYPRGEAPVVSCVTYVKAGSADETPGITGIAHQLEHLAFKGTPNIGTRDYEAEKKVLAEIDALYQQVQAFEQTVPAESRESFSSLLAQVSSGGPASAPDKTAKDLEALFAAWQKAGFAPNEDERQKLVKLVQAFAGKVSEAEQFVEQNQYANVIDRNGGVGLNAFTSTDRTVYHVSLPSNKLELWAALESDRYRNTVPRQLEKEKQVVLEERRSRTESNAFGKLYEALIGAAFKTHPYGMPVIGSRADIIGYTRQKVLGFYRRNYVPGNTIMALVGDIDVAAARQTITDYFGRIPAGAVPPGPAAVEPPQDAERRVQIEFPAQPLLLVAYHVPERKHSDTPALVMLDEIASSGRTSRLYSRLVKTKKAASAGSWIGPGERCPRLLCFSAEPADGGSPDELEANLLAEIEKLGAEAATAGEMARVVTRYRAQVLRDLRSNMRLAQELADFQALNGDWRELFREIRAISAVTPEQVAAAARRYLTPQNRTTARLVSTNSAPPRAPAAPENILGVPVK